MTTESQFKISTMTCSGSLKEPESGSLNIRDLTLFLPINEHIVGLKSQYGTRGYVKSKKTPFKNQLTISLRNGVNVKIFLNGSLHFTGCRKVSDCKRAIQQINDAIGCVVPTEIMMYQNVWGLILDSQDNFYTQNGEYIGMYNRERDRYIIGSTEYALIDNVLVSKGDVKNIYGDQLSDVQYAFIRNDIKPKFLRYDYNNKTIFHKETKEIVGHIVLPESGVSFTFENEHPILYKPDVTPVNFDNYEINIDCINTTFEIGKEIDRRELYEFLRNKGYIAKYNPETYSGVKITWKGPAGICGCENVSVCDKVSFMVFRTGKVIACGFRDVDTIGVTIYKFINLILQ